MMSERERFWEADSYAVVGRQTSRKAYPRITYSALKDLGKTVYAVDPDGGTVEDDAAYPDFAALPGPVARAADAGVRRIWIHQMTDTPEALAEAERRGLSVIAGHCAVMYVKPGFSGHAVHRGIWKLLGKY